MLKVKLLHRCFSHFLNCTNGTKSHNASHMRRQLRYYQRMVRSEIRILLEIVLNISKCLTVSCPTKFLLRQWHQFCLFQLAYSMNLVCSQMCTFFCPLWKRRFSLLPAGTHIHIWQHIQQKDSTFCLPLHSYALAIHLKNEVLR